MALWTTFLWSLSWKEERGNLPQMKTSKANLHVLQHLQMIGVEAPGGVFIKYFDLKQQNTRQGNKWKAQKISDYLNRNVTTSMLPFRTAVSIGVIFWWSPMYSFAPLKRQGLKIFKVQVGLSTPSDENLNNLQVVVLSRQEKWSSLHLVLLVHNLSNQVRTKK